MSHRLYKAKADHNGEWVFGYYLEVAGISFILPEGKPLNAIVQVRPETVCQGTGDKDKNRTEMWEGDKVRFAEWTKGKMCWEGTIKYEHCIFVIVGGPNEECRTNFYIQLSRLPSERIEVIGNIHDEEDANAW